MAGHEWKDWFEREEFIGQISDIRVQNLQVEREVVQKRTFTRWMNLHLEKCNPPMEVQDLFRDIQDGQILMALLEELSGCKLLHGFKKSSHRIFRLNNIAKVLTFLEERNVKLVSIDAADVADGNASIVLGLIWNIILFFQIKELTGNIKSQFPSSSSLSSIPTSSDSDTSHSSTPSEERRPSIAMRDHGKVIKTLLQWVQRRTRKYGVAVQDFGKSWTSGLAFLAVIKSIDPTLVDMRRSLLRTAKENLEDAFRTAHYSLGIPRLLEPEDVTINPPDEQSIMTYVSQFLEHFPGIEEPQDVSEVIERSVSMGRLSSRSSDYELMRNGVHRSRQRERPYVVRKDWVQPPPKIFVSTVSDDKEAMSPTSPSSLSWASEDLSGQSTTSPNGNPQDEGKEVFTISTSNSPQPSYVDSFTSSSAAESVICDSAIGSPDSWAESEAATPDRFGESRSEESPTDSVMALDANLPPSTPEEVTLEGQLLPSVTGKPQDEQSLPELFIDEGIYSLSSLDSTLERGKDSLEKQEIEEKEHEQEDTSSHILDGSFEHMPDQKESSNKTQRDSKQRDMSKGQRNVPPSQREPSLELSDIPQKTEPVETSQSPHSFDRVNPDSLDPNEMTGEVEVESVSVTKHKTTSVSEREREEEQLKDVVDKRQDEVTKGAETQNGHIEPQENVCSELNDIMEQTDIHPFQDMEQIQPSQARSKEGGSNAEENHTDQTDSQTSVLDAVYPQSSDLPEGGVERDEKAGDEDPGESRSSGGHLINMNADTPDGPRPTDASGHDPNFAGVADEIPESAICRHVESRHDDSIEPTDSIVSTVIQATDNTIETQQYPLGSPLDQVNHLHNIEVSDVNQACDNIVTEVDHDEVESHTLANAIHTLSHPAQSEKMEEAESDIAGPSNGDREGDEANSDKHNINKMVDTDHNGSRLVELANDNEVANMEKKAVSESTDLFYADLDREELMSEPLDPMDLFYPDKEEAMLSDQPEREESMFSSCFSVSALQPAPASEPLNTHSLPETHPPSLTESHSSNPLGEEEIGDDSTSQEDRMIQGRDKMAEETHEGAGEQAKPQERCTLLKDQASGSLGVLEEVEAESHHAAERSDLIKTHEEKLAAARENMKSMRGEEESNGAKLEKQLSSLCHRKVAESDKLRDNQKSVATSQTQSTNSKTSRKESKVSAAAECLMTKSELYMLLILWLILYCLLVLPQIDIRTLPSLLFNLED
ncbi:calmin [Osmerus mordax]|uniref:calmin n=1 Tax=Osmerus mordax TaxID=8014 RepID=UPI00350EE445